MSLFEKLSGMSERPMIMSMTTPDDRRPDSSVPAQGDSDGAEHVRSSAHHSHSHDSHGPEPPHSNAGDQTIASSYTPAAMPIMVRAGTTNTEDIR
jgi:hypothetical protein